MLCILYFSFATRDMTPTDLRDLLVVSVEKNRRLGITGVLLYEDGLFMQVLEGPEAGVRGLLDSIRRDNRNTGLEILVDAPIDERHFPDWGMAFAPMAELSAEEQLFCRSLAKALPDQPRGPLRPSIEALIRRFCTVAKGGFF